MGTAPLHCTPINSSSSSSSSTRARRKCTISCSLPCPPSPTHLGRNRSATGRPGPRCAASKKKACSARPRAVWKVTAAAGCASRGAGRGGVVGEHQRATVVRLSPLKPADSHRQPARPSCTSSTHHRNPARAPAAASRRAPSWPAPAPRRRRHHRSQRPPCPCRPAAARSAPARHSSSSGDSRAQPWSMSRFCVPVAGLSQPAHPAPCHPSRTAPHSTAQHRTAPHSTAPCAAAQSRGP